MKVRWTDKALDNLQNIHDYIAQDSRFYALRMVDRLTSRSKRIAFMPFLDFKSKIDDHFLVATKMTNNKIYCKIIDLTKNIFLREPQDGSGFLREGTEHRNLLFVPKWWITNRGLRCCEEIAEMAICFYPEFTEGDIDSFSKAIEQLLRNNANNTSLFKSEKIFFNKSNTLFESRNIDNSKDFASCLWNIIRLGLVNSLVDWLILYPLRHVKTDSFLLGFDGLSILNSNDKYNWNKISENYHSDAKYWNPSSGTFEGTSHISFKDFSSIPAWLVCEVSGTSDTSRQRAGDFMRTFIAVFFSYLNSTIPNLLIKSGEKLANYSIQFPNDSSKSKCGYIRASIGNLHPVLLMEKPLNISSDLVDQIQHWYTSRAKSSSNDKNNPVNRATTASHFLHYGIIHNGLERFIHFFIALDALFGERGHVEKNIKKGIKQTFLGDLNWENRVDWLFDLRSELVHGGISNIKKWDDFNNYRKHFKSDPMKDIQTAAMSALIVYFSNRVFDHLFEGNANPIS